MRALWLVALIVGLAVAADANALGRRTPAVLPPVPVEISQRGPDAVRVVLSEGRILPCTSGDDHLIYAGRLASGELLRTTTTRECVCVQQTFAPFADVDWSNGFVACRVGSCSYRRAGCAQGNDPTIRVSLGSRRSD
jgi:hypothetical protein